MTGQRLQRAHIAGYERLAAWGDLLDQINVFPVADSDTGKNLKASLAPLLSLQDRPHAVRRRLLQSATGNSGNIAAAFFSEFLMAENLPEIQGAARAGRDRAWSVLADPKPGTMLSVMDALVESLAIHSVDADPPPAAHVIDHLAQAVRDTHDQLPVLRQAGVVDAGALGLHIYLEGFFQSLAGTENGGPAILATLDGRLHIAADFTDKTAAAYCVDTLVRPHGPDRPDLDALSAHGRSVIAVAEEDCVKIHLHTQDRDRLRTAMESVGRVVDWKESPISGAAAPGAVNGPDRRIHIMTDAAGSLSPEDAARLGITLLESILVVDGESIPETLFAPEALYRAMRRGRPVATAQASIFARHQQYQSVLSRYRRVLYLCVGSVYTTNHQVACAWKRENDPEDRLTILDSSAASGKLAVMAMATARYAAQTEDFDAVVRFSQWAAEQCRELVFLDQLKYLARGGANFQDQRIFRRPAQQKAGDQPHGQRRRTGRPGQEPGPAGSIRPGTSGTVGGAPKRGRPDPAPVHRQPPLARTGGRAGGTGPVPGWGNPLPAPLPDLGGPYGSGDLGHRLFTRIPCMRCPVNAYTSDEIAGRRFAVVIPLFNHGAAVARVAEQALALGFPVIVVDDGSTDSGGDALTSIPGLRLLRHEKNLGKGAALLTGFAAASQIADWAVTLDADGQHCPADANHLIDAIPKGVRPIVVGRRIGMDADQVPWTSRFGRGFSNFWLRVSGGPAVADSQSGFRIYPLPETLALKVQARRYQYEIEVLAEARRSRIPVIEAPVRVSYGAAGKRISHFRPWVDFCRNTAMFKRLIMRRIFQGPPP